MQKADSIPSDCPILKAIDWEETDLVMNMPSTNSPYYFLFMVIDKSLIDSLYAEARENPRLRQSRDMRTSPADVSQRMLNALLPGTVVPIHRHRNSSESVLCLDGELYEVIYEMLPDADGRLRPVEAERYHLSAAGECRGCQVPLGAWHAVEVVRPSVIFEAKDGAYAPATPEDLYTEE